MVNCYRLPVHFFLFPPSCVDVSLHVDSSDMFLHQIADLQSVRAREKLIMLFLEKGGVFFWRGSPSHEVFMIKNALF